MIKEINSLAKASSSEGDADLAVCVRALGTGIETLTTATDILLNAKDEDAL